MRHLDVSDRREHGLQGRLPPMGAPNAHRRLSGRFALAGPVSPWSIHTLTGAAYKLLYDINTKAGDPPMMPDGNYIRPECIKEWRKILYRAQNFFMLEACERYQMHAREQRPLMNLFILWLSLHEPRFFLPRIQQLGPDDDLIRLGKLQFFRELLPAMSTIPNA